MLRVVVNRAAGDLVREVEVEEQAAGGGRIATRNFEANALSRTGTRTPFSSILAPPALRGAFSSTALLTSSRNPEHLQLG